MLSGKVKGQTPKVEKQQKKKKKTGRAKRRIQYNRRYLKFHFQNNYNECSNREISGKS